MASQAGFEDVVEDRARNWRRRLLERGPLEGDVKENWSQGPWRR